jgi:hypothetical protein
MQVYSALHVSKSCTLRNLGEETVCFHESRKQSYAMDTVCGISSTVEENYNELEYILFL